LNDSRFSIDNGASERAIRPLAIGRTNWLHVGGDGGLKTAAVLLSICASATRHRLNPWWYLRNVLDQRAGRSAGDDVGDLLPDAWPPTGPRTGMACPPTLPPAVGSPVNFLPRILVPPVTLGRFAQY
jgi:hypothetical protein